MKTMDAALSLLETNLMRFQGVAVQYLRGDMSLDVHALPGQTRQSHDADFSVTVDARLYDFLVPTRELALTPEIGDRIVWRDTAFEVLDSLGEGCWRYDTAYRHFKRIHTKEVASG